MKVYNLLSIMIILMCIISGCGQARANNNFEYPSDKQLEALGRLDPLQLLTDNKVIFSLNKKEIVDNLQDKIDLPQWAKQLPNGRIQLEQYEGCSEPIILSYAFLGSGELSSVVYHISDQFNTSAVIQDYPAVLTQIREDMITLYGDNFREGYPNTECETYEELIQLLKDNEAGHYTMYFSSGSAFVFNIGEGCTDDSMHNFDIMITLK